MKHRIAERVDAAKPRALDSLGAARRRTLALTACPGDELLARRSPPMSPLVRDLARVGDREEI